MEKADDHNRMDIRKAKCLKQSGELGTQFRLYFSMVGLNQVALDFHQAMDVPGKILLHNNKI